MFDRYANLSEEELGDLPQEELVPILYALIQEIARLRALVEPKEWADMMEGRK